MLGIRLAWKNCQSFTLENVIEKKPTKISNITEDRIILLEKMTSHCGYTIREDLKLNGKTYVNESGDPIFCMC